MHNRHGLVDTGLISVYNRGWGFIPSLLGCTIWNVEYFSSIIFVWGAANILVVIGRELRCEIKKTHQWSSTFCFMSNYFDSKLAAKLQNRIVAFSMRFVQSLCVKDGSCRNGLIQLELLLWTRCWHITFHSLGAPVKITLSRLKQLLPFVLNQAEGEFLSQRNSHLMELLPIQSLALLEQLETSTMQLGLDIFCDGATHSAPTTRAGSSLHTFGRGIVVFGFSNYLLEELACRQCLCRKMPRVFGFPSA